MPQLTFYEAARELFVVVLRADRTVIGRADHCDIALPDEAVSRVHCVIEHGPRGTRLVDRSRHGTSVNGRVVQEALLEDGDEIDLVAYRIRYAAFEHGEPPSPTASLLGKPLPVHEELVAGDEHGVASAGVRLRFVRGPRTDERVPVVTGVTTFGGPGSQHVLDDQLPARALTLHVVRGRPMVEAASAGVFLSGVRVRARTPVLAGEEVRIGPYGFVLEPAVAEQQPSVRGFGEMVGASPVMQKLFGALARMAVHDQPVLLIGESGTGKELAARGLHIESARREAPFVALNCAAIAANLFESELFGHEKGAFTGATQRADGAFHRADGGTLFLDEIGELSVDLQAKLLRTLESGEVRRVGGHAPSFPDVRVVAATNRNLPQRVEDGAFRGDLYWRLAVLTVRMPSLRERPDDLRLLVRTLLDRLDPAIRIEERALDRIRTYDWPGNVRELKNVLTRAFVMHGSPLTVEAIQFDPWGINEAPGRSTIRTSPDGEAKRLAEALERAGGNRSQAARLLGMPRSTLLYKLDKYGLSER